MMVDIGYVRTLPTPVTLAILKNTPGLEKMQVVQRGSRLSVHPVTAAEWRIILQLGKALDKAMAGERR